MVSIDEIHYVIESGEVGDWALLGERRNAESDGEIGVCSASADGVDGVPADGDETAAVATVFPGLAERRRETKMIEYHYIW